jgi:hypothetical protein
LTSSCARQRVGILIGMPRGMAVSETDESPARQPAGAFGLADFLADLREELAVAQQQAAGAALQLEVEEVSVALEVAVTTGKRGGGSGKLSAKFWVLAAEVGGTGELSSQRVGTQKMTLTLKPQMEQVTYDRQGREVQRTTRKVNVSGRVEAGEEAPRLQRATDG